jgi:putative endopeptidase
VRSFRLVLVCTILLVLGLAAAQSDRSAGAAQVAKSQERTAIKDTAPPSDSAIKSFDLNAMDRSAEPCQDFYKYACGGWVAHHPVPADLGSYGRFTELAEQNREILHRILELAANPTPQRSAIMQKIGDFYEACMNEDAVNRAGDQPVKPELQRIAAISSAPQLIEEIARLQSMNVPVLFRFGQTADYHNASMTIAALDQGGLGLANKDYYTKADPKSAETRDRYAQHIEAMLRLAGESSEAAAAAARNVLNIETRLANASLGPVELRNPTNRDHPMTPQAVSELAPKLEFAQFVRDAGAPAFTKINLNNPDFVKQLNALLTEIPLEQWKQYLEWHLLNSTAAYLAAPFEEENFKFNESYLGGAQQMQPRWKRCVRATDQNLGEALGQPYVDETFGVEGKTRTLEMVKAIEQAMGQDLEQLPWMTPATKKAAAEKLALVTNKIGFPDHWRDYSNVRVARDDFAGNVLRARTFEHRRNLNKIGKPVDKSEWSMSPPTVNAYYNPPENNINFPAGILQPPFYSNKADDAVNFGAVGAVIGHELTHGFDDSGSRFDGNGDLRDWWTKQDNQEFHTRTECVAHEYDQFPVGDLHVNGHLTLGENTADNGGLRISMRALHNRMQQLGNSPQNVDGFTPEQRFFIAYAQVWCENQTPASARRQVLTNPHSPGRYRVQGPLQNMPEFQQAFSCKVGDKMVSAEPCRVW